MGIRLEKISVINYEDVLSLQVFEEQNGFVSSPAYALVQAYVYYKTAFPFAIYNDNTIIGFIMFGFYESRHIHCGNFSLISSIKIKATEKRRYYKAYNM